MYEPKLYLVFQKNNMLKKILFLFCILFSCFSTVFAQEQEYVLQYASCKELIQSPYIADLTALKESKCIALSQENNPAVILLSQKQEVLATQTIQQEILDTLKTKYYRGEQLKVVFSGELKDISSAKIQIKVQEKNYDTIMTPT